MKRIIEIPDHVVEAIQNGEDYRYDIHTAIAQSTPYSPAGVLTEAEKIICRVYLEDLDKMHTCNEYKLLMSLIDNTQAVDLWQMRQEATENALKKAEVLYGRSQGEWKHIGGDEWVCSECGHVITTEGSWEKPLSIGAYHCENCGADMKGGTE